MTIVRRAGEVLGGAAYNAFVPLAVVVSVLLLEHMITLAAPLWERWLFYGRDRVELEFLQNVEERLLTRGDLQQFLEAVLAAVRDHLQSPSAFIAALDAAELSLIVMAGKRGMITPEALPEALNRLDGGARPRQEFLWGDFWILPLHQRRRSEMDVDETPPLLGLMGIAHRGQPEGMEHDQREALWLLADRASLALEDRQLQQHVFRSLEDLQPL
jgi:hypothetical protein